jgi:hypothetical protein
MFIISKIVGFCNVSLLISEDRRNLMSREPFEPFEVHPDCVPPGFLPFALGTSAEVEKGIFAKSDLCSGNAFPQLDLEDGGKCSIRRIFSRESLDRNRKSSPTYRLILFFSPTFPRYSQNTQGDRTKAPRPSAAMVFPIPPPSPRHVCGGVDMFSPTPLIMPSFDHIHEYSDPFTHSTVIVEGVSCVCYPAPLFPRTVHCRLHIQDVWRSTRGRGQEGEG